MWDTLLGRVSGEDTGDIGHVQAKGAGRCRAVNGLERVRGVKVNELQFGGRHLFFLVFCPQVVQYLLKVLGSFLYYLK